MSSLRYHLRQTTLFPITTLSSARAAVPQHAEEPDNTCFLSEQPLRWARDLCGAPGWHRLPGGCRSSAMGTILRWHGGTASSARRSRDGATGSLLASCRSEATGQGAGYKARAFVFALIASLYKHTTRVALGPSHDFMRALNKPGKNIILLVSVSSPHL